ncbi:MAG: GIY-YIG nuclease family protein [Gudongella sp.]|nr:GIY-YIG nuclease family protein [Gudongella sp.]
MDKKELKELYKNSKPNMGIFIIKSNTDSKCYIQETKNLKSAMNRAKFQLDYGNYPNKELQIKWKENGGIDFTIEILEKLEYDKNELKVDYKDELKILQMIWEDKLFNKGMEFYK